jgi:hypothetical protein
MAYTTIDGDQILRANVPLRRDLLAAVDDYRRKRADLPSRPQAVAQLIMAGLKNQPEPLKDLQVKKKPPRGYGAAYCFSWWW